MTNENALLEINALTLHYGVIPAVRGLSFKIQKGQVISLMGTNGSGKTTTLRGISGILPPSGGQVLFEGKDISKESPHKIVQMGISHVPEGRGIFPQLTVIENLKMGAYIRNDNQGIKEDIEKYLELFPNLEDRKKEYGGTLSGGEQQMLAIARALMAKPKLLLLDEPSMGLAPLVVKEIFGAIKAISNEGVTILLVEQNTKMALSVSHYGYVLETGEIVAEGTADELSNDSAIKNIYLGNTQN